MMMVISIGIAVVLTLLVARESDLIRLCLIPFKWLRSAIYRRFSSNTTTAVATCEDSDVGAERRRAEDALKRGHHHRHALVTRDLTKVYDGFTAVDHISFAVDKKECFGLLGVNGAGKSTMFNMLTGDLPMSDGNAYIFDSNLRSSLRRYQTYVGFCPQVDALLDKLTGRETLELLCALRGVPADKQAPVITQMVSLVDLGPDADNLTSTYSGGTKRKLSLGLAVIGNLPVILLDEPTAGVDPAGRRKIWSTITQAQRNGSAIVFTSHSMAECETLCGRMVIMVNGTFRCLGSSQHLKTKFSQGFSVTIKLKPSDHQSVVVSNLLASMERYFPGKNALKDSHQCILHFHITDTELRWSELFEIVQQLQAEFHFEDVVVSDASLEQIFLAFAAKRVAMIPSA